MAFFPRLSPAGDFTPQALFRLLDDYDVHRSSNDRSSGARSSISSFAPKFDVRELKNAYQLDGELPGISQENIDIEFTDPQTLAIKGHVKREYTSSSGEDTAMNDADEAASNSRQPTVEDEETAPSAVSKPTESGNKQTSKASKAPRNKYWASERSVGEFHRSFNFPERVDQEAVHANLKDGILSIVVPKAAPPVSKKIRVD